MSLYENLSDIDNKSLVKRGNTNRDGPQSILTERVVDGRTSGMSRSPEKRVRMRPEALKNVSTRDL